MLVLVVGPSGAGKDSLLKAARETFRDDARVSFVRRVITRPPDPDGEDHESVTDAEFDARTFALSWSAHGLRYGIPVAAARQTDVVVANVSRGVISEAARLTRVRVIEVTASADILAARLAARGRETSDDVARRLGRNATIPVDVEQETVLNDGTLAEAVGHFIAALRRAISDAGATP